MITTIIFDWGGVLTKGRYTRSILGLIEEEKQVPPSSISEAFDKLIVEINEDRLSFEAFATQVAERCGLDITEQELSSIFRRAIRPNEAVIERAQALKEQYALVMLSDNDRMTVSNLQRDHADMMHLFPKKFFSYDLKIKKPDQRVFQHVIKELGVAPSECLFIDDKQKNVDAAIKEGMQALRYQEADQFQEELDRILQQA